jgi:hypothetical protein
VSLGSHPPYFKRFALGEKSPERIHYTAHVIDTRKDLVSTDLGSSAAEVHRTVGSFSLSSTCDKRCSMTSIPQDPTERPSDGTDSEGGSIGNNHLAVVTPVQASSPMSRRRSDPLAIDFAGVVSPRIGCTTASLGEDCYPPTVPTRRNVSRAVQENSANRNSNALLSTETSSSGEHKKTA